MRRATAAVHHEQALGGEAAALHQRLHAQLQRLVGKRLELVEQRRDDGRVEHHQREVERRPHAPGPDPPQTARRPHQPEHQRQQRQPDQRTDRQPLARSATKIAGVVRLKPKRCSSQKCCRPQTASRSRPPISANAATSASWYASAPQRGCSAGSRTALSASSPPSTSSPKQHGARNAVSAARAGPWPACSRRPAGAPARHDGGKAAARCRGRRDMAHLARGQPQRVSSAATRRQRRPG